MRLVRLGHEPAFEEIYDRHHRGILSFCRHMLGSKEEAEDAVQHAFIAAYRDLQASNKPIHLKAWLYTIARNRCLSMLRARREQVSIDDVEPSTDGLAAEVQRRQDLKDMLRDLGRLPEDQRAALVLSEIGALSHEEIAMTLDVRKEKVKALVFQARESLLSSRKARDTDCQEIQQQLSVLRGGALRRTQLRRHVEQCAACTAYREEVQRQRAALAIILPVVPSAGLKSGVLTGALAAGGGGGAVAAGAAAGGLGAKLIVGAVLMGAGVGGGILAIDELRSPPPSQAEDREQRRQPDLAMIGGAGYVRSDAAGRPVESEVLRTVAALRSRAQTVAVERDTSGRIVRLQPVWAGGIAGKRTGPDPAVVVGVLPPTPSVVPGDVPGAPGGRDDGRGGSAGTGQDQGGDPGKLKKPKKPKKAKKPKIPQGQGAQGKGNAYGRGRAPAAGSGGGDAPRGGGPKKDTPSSGGQGPKPKGNGKPAKGGPKKSRQAPASGGPRGRSRAKAAPPPPPPAAPPSDPKGKGHGNGNGNGNGHDKPDRGNAPSGGPVDKVKETVSGAADKAGMRAVTDAVLGIGA